MNRNAARAQSQHDTSRARRFEGSQVTEQTAPGRSTTTLHGVPLIAAAGVPVLVALALYLPAVRNGFIWDDPLILQQLRAIHSVGDLLVPPTIIPKFYFRPIIFVTYLIDRAIGGESPFWFHASVILWHAANTLLVFALAHRLFPGAWLIASGAALLFAVFPTHVESVAWMAGRSDVIVCTFVLTTVLLFMQRERWWTSWIGAAVFLLAALSKEMALACVVLVPLLDLLSTGKLQWTRYLPLILAAGAYFALRQQALGAFVGGIATGATPVQLGPDLLRALGFYVVRAIAPIGLSPYIPEIPDSWGYLLIGSIALSVGVTLTAVGWRHGRWEVGYLVAWFLLTLAPSLTVIVRRSASAVLADRYLYVPSVASCVLIMWALARLAALRRLAPQWALATAGVISIGFAVQVVSYTRTWTDNLTFWSAVATRAPLDTLANRELASALLQRERLPEAEQALQRALAGTSSPEDRAMTYSNLGNLYRRTQRYDDAQRAFEEALKIGPHPALYHNLGMTLMASAEQANARGDQVVVQHDVVEARAAFEHALQLGSQASAARTYLEWDGAKTHALLGQVLLSLGDRNGARQHLEESLRIQPTGPTADVTRQFLLRVQQQ